MASSRRLLLYFGIHIGVSSAADYFYKDRWDWADPSVITGATAGKTNECGNPGQSPIDIPIGEVKQNDNLALAFRAGGAFEGKTICTNEVQQFLNAHTYEVEFPMESPTCGAKVKHGYPTAVWGGKQYFLKQFHYHAPSEHTIEGKYYDMEVHHVHIAEDGQVLVVAVMVKVGAENDFLAQFWKHFPTVLETKVSPHANQAWTRFIPYADFFPADRGFYHYMGSFTTPACSFAGQVVWVVMRDPVEMSWDQLSEYRTTISVLPKGQRQVLIDEKLTCSALPGVNAKWDPSKGVNNRPTQPLAGRDIFCSGSGCTPIEGPALCADAAEAMESGPLHAVIGSGTYVIGGVFALLALVLCLTMCCKSQKQGKASTRGMQLTPRDDEHTPRLLASDSDE